MKKADTTKREQEKRKGFTNQTMFDLKSATSPMTYHSITVHRTGKA